MPRKTFLPCCKVFVLFLILFFCSPALSSDFDIGSLVMDSVILNNTLNGQPFEARIVKHLDFGVGQEHNGSLLSLGFYGGNSGKSFDDQFMSWLPTINDYLLAEPQDVVCVPNSLFGEQYRGGALDACGVYLMNEFAVQDLAVTAGSLGSRGALYLIQHAELFVSADSLRLTVFASPRGFVALDPVNIGSIQVPVVTYVGDETADPQAYADAAALHEALRSFNPFLPEELNVDPDGRHGFYKVHNDSLAGLAGDAARKESYMYQQRAFGDKIAFGDADPLSVKKWTIH